MASQTPKFHHPAASIPDSAFSVFYSNSPAPASYCKLSTSSVCVCVCGQTGQCADYNTIFSYTYIRFSIRVSLMVYHFTSDSKFGVWSHFKFDYSRASDQYNSRFPYLTAKSFHYHQLESDSPRSFNDRRFAFGGFVVFDWCDLWICGFSALWWIFILWVWFMGLRVFWFVMGFRFAIWGFDGYITVYASLYLPIWYTTKVFRRERQQVLWFFFFLIE